MKLIIINELTDGQSDIMILLLFHHKGNKTYELYKTVVTYLCYLFRHIYGHS